MIFHPLYGGVTIHRLEDVDILYTGKPLAAGHRETTGKCFWHMSIVAPYDKKSKDMPLTKKLLIVERLLLSKLP